MQPREAQHVGNLVEWHAAPVNVCRLLVAGYGTTSSRADSCGTAEAAASTSSSTAAKLAIYRVSVTGYDRQR